MLSRGRCCLGVWEPTEDCKKATVGDFLSWMTDGIEAYCVYLGHSIAPVDCWPPRPGSELTPGTALSRTSRSSLSADFHCSSLSSSEKRIWWCERHSGTTQSAPWPPGKGFLCSLQRWERYLVAVTMGVMEKLLEPQQKNKSALLVVSSNLLILVILVIY